MIRNLLSILFMLVILTNSWSQQDEDPVILIGATGKVSYTAKPGLNSMAIVPGALVKVDGILSVKGKSTATLQYKRKIKHVGPNQTIALSELFGMSSTSSLSFDTKFAGYVEDAFVMAYYTPETGAEPWGQLKKKKGMGDGWGVVGGSRDTTARRGTGDGWGVVGGKAQKSTGDGWGGTGSVIYALQPFGHLAQGNVVFAWSRPAGKPIYIIEITDSNGKLIQKGSTSDTSLVMNLSSTAFEEGETYTWQVRTQGTANARSNELTFQMNSIADRDNILSKTEKTAAFENAPQEVRHLMHAVAMEEKEWYADAIEYYAKAQRMKGSKSATPRLMHSAFWNRRGIPARAVSVYNVN